MKEFQLISAIRRMLPELPSHVLAGAGDDGALLKGSKLPTVVTIDTQIEGVHFNLQWLSIKGAGERSVEVALSDLAAMGAVPKTLFVALNLPVRLETRKAVSLVRGILTASKRSDCFVAGGNVVLYQGPLALTVTALGQVPRGRKAFVRSSALPGDDIYATGMPGLARLGFEALSHQDSSSGELSPPGFTRSRFIKSAVKKFLSPRACFKEIEFLSSKVRINALIDLSDGLAGDLGHILKESGVGAETTLQVTTQYEKSCREFGIKPEACFFGPSDDYELLFTIKPVEIEPVKHEFKKHFARDLVKIGTITSKKGLWFVAEDGGKRRIQAMSYEHCS